MPTLAELAHARDQLRHQRERRSKLRHRLLNQAHRAQVAIRLAGRKIARLSKRIKKKKAAEGHGLSHNGAEFIARFEGVRLKSYNDPAGHCTIGVGHLLSMGPCGEPMTITEQKAFDLLESDAKVAANAVRDLVRVPLNQAQTDALISFTFNEGTGSLASSDLLRLLNSGSYRSVPGELMRWVFANGVKLPGLVTRRRAEGHLFTTGEYH